MELCQTKGQELMDSNGNEIIITCLGDVLASDTYYTLGKGIGSKIQDLKKYYLDLEKNLFIGSDIVICNLESPLAADHSDLRLPFAGHPLSVQLLKILGISIVSIANNHILDHGEKGFNQTVSALAENGFNYIGVKEGIISKIKLIDCKNKKIAFSGFNAVKDHPDNSFIADLDRDTVFRTLEEIKKQSPDYIIFSFHWGNEYVTWPSPAQVDLAHELTDNGVNVIIGHHPHVVQPVEKYNGGIIIYSLGNFLFDMFWSEKVRNGMQVDLILNEDRSIDYEIKPFRIRSGFTQDYTRTRKVFSILEKADKTLKLLQSGLREVYEKKYQRECRKRKLQARIKMKFFLLKNLFFLSPQSRELFFRNIKTKSRSLWKNS